MPARRVVVCPWQLICQCQLELLKTSYDTPDSQALFPSVLPALSLDQREALLAKPAGGEFAVVTVEYL
jgi:hypothetical protein